MPNSIIDTIRNARSQSGKFTKGSAYYVNKSYLKSFRCANCNHYDPDEYSCDLVYSEGDPNPGSISPTGSCSLYNARPPRIMAMQMLWGRGGASGLAPENARATAFMFTYAFLDEQPPEALLDKASITPDQIKSSWLYKRIESIYGNGGGY